MFRHMYAILASDYIGRDKCLYAYCVQNIKGCEYALEAADYHVVLESQHSNFTLVNFVHARMW